MAIVQEISEIHGPQSLSKSPGPGPDSLDPECLLSEDVVGHDKPKSVSVVDEEEVPSKPRQTRNRTLREDDWDERRGLITSLYKTMKLDDLMIEMKRHGFNAARSMYLRRIVQWGINKNFKASEKQAVINLSEASLSGPDSNTISSIPSDRLLRFAKDRRRRARQIRKARSPYGHSSMLDTRQAISFSSPRSFHDVTSVAKKINDHYTSNVVTDGTFLYSPSERHSELFFMRLREYIHVRVEVFTSRSPTGMREADAGTLHNTPRSQSRISTHLFFASNASMIGGSTKMYEWLDKACELAKDVLQQAHWRLLTLFSDICELFKFNPKVGHSIARFFADMAEVIYPDSQHCIVQLFRLFLRVAQQKPVLEIVGKIAMDVLRDLHPKDGKIQALVQEDVVELYSCLGLPESAVRIAKQNKDFCLAIFGSDHYHTRWAMFNLVRLYHDSRDSASVLHEGMALLQIYEEGYIPPDPISIVTRRILGDSCLALGTLEDAMRHYSMQSDLQRQLFHVLGLTHYVKAHELEYTQRMIYNIKRKQDPYGFPEKAVWVDSVPRRQADTFFGHCCQFYGW